MCELFGINSDESCQINGYLQEFFSHSNAHPHGWGLACIDGKESMIEKEPIQASRSNYLKERLSVPIQVTTGLAHIRYATIGNVDYRNCHPYRMQDAGGRVWTMIHNGTIFDCPALNKYVGIQRGDTDSERILLYMIERVNQEEANAGRPLEREERFRLLDEILVEISKGNKVNLILYDGELFYVHTNYAGSLYKLSAEGKVVIATVPLTDEAWEPEIFTTLVAYDKGKLVMRGTNHGNEYEDSEENLKFLYSVFSDL
jgi:glutamine amidotransferase